MNRFGKKLTQTLTCAVGLFLLTAHFSCESGIPPPTSLAERYRFEGALVKDLNSNFALIRTTLLRDDTSVGDAVIRFGGDSLAYLPDSTFFRAVLPSGDYPLGTYEIEITDSTLFSDTLLIGVPDTFGITSVFPDSPRVKAGRTVILEWSGSAGSEGYVIAAVKRDSVYEGIGFSQYVESQFPESPFPDSAFFRSFNNENDTGWYYLYVYAFVGSPDSALSADLLPVPMPSQLPDNYTLDILTGRFGTIVVALYDSMEVRLN